MGVMSFHNGLQPENRDLEMLIDLIQAVHKSSNLEEIYKVALDSAIRLENVDLIMVYLVDEERREAVLEAHRNLTEDYINRAGRIPYPKGVTWKVINSGTTLNLQDIQKDSAIGPAGQDLGHHSALGIPIILDEKVIGVIWFVSYKERKFNKKEVKFLSSLGNQIAVAIAKIKKTEELKERNRNLSILSEISQAVHQSSDLKQVYKIVLEVAEDLDFVDLVSVYLTEEEGDKKEAVLQVQGGLSERRFKLPKRIPYPDGIFWQVIKSGDFGYYEDATHLSFLEGTAGRLPEQRAFLSIPIKSDSETIGVVSFSGFEKNSFTEQQLNFLLSLGNQIGIAIARAKTFEEIKQWKDNLLESEQRYHVLIENTYDLVCEISIDGRFLYVSPKVKDLLGYEQEELVGRSVFEHIHPDDVPDTRAAFVKAASTSSSVNVVFRYEYKDGEWRWLECMGRSFQTAAGDIRGVIACRDITETRLIGEEVLRAGRSERRFINPAEAPINLMVATQSTLLREGIRKMLELEKNIKIVAEASTGQEIMPLLEQKKPDVLFLDTGLAGLEITETLELIRGEEIETKVLLLLHTADEEVIINAISLGSSGILTDISDAEQLTKAIKAVNKDEIWAKRRTIKKALTRLLPLRKTRLRLVKSILTKREEEIVELVSKGYSNKQIARRLHISENTLKTHLVNIFKKLGVNSRHQLVYDFLGEATIKTSSK